jgi:hypothetical protein
MIRIPIHFRQQTGGECGYFPPCSRPFAVWHLASENPIFVSCQVAADGARHGARGQATALSAGAHGTSPRTTRDHPNGKFAHRGPVPRFNPFNHGKRGQMPALEQGRRGENALRMDAVAVEMFSDAVARGIAPRHPDMVEGGAETALRRLLRGGALALLSRVHAVREAAGEGSPTTQLLRPSRGRSQRMPNVLFSAPATRHE